MATVIRFPDNPERLWRSVRGVLEKTMLDAGADTNMIDAVSAGIRTALPRYCVSFDIQFQTPADLTPDQRAAVEGTLEAGKAELARQIHNYTNQLLLERIELEIELYRLRRYSESVTDSDGV